MGGTSFHGDLVFLEDRCKWSEASDLLDVLMIALLFDEDPRSENLTLYCRFSTHACLSLLELNVGMSVLKSDSSTTRPVLYLHCSRNGTPVDVPFFRDKVVAYFSLRGQESFKVTRHRQVLAVPNPLARR